MRDVMKPTDLRIRCGVLLAAVCVVMYLLNRFSPMCCDDWHYVFIFGTLEPISSLKDIFVSQYHHYLQFNGRLPVHVLVQLFDGLLGKAVFNVFNAMMFALCLWALARVTKSDKKDYYKVMSVAFAVLFLVMPGFKDVFLWLSGSINYLWVGTALLLFHHLLERETMPRWAYLPLALFALVCGWSNEAFVIGLAPAYFIYYLILHRERLRPHRLWMLGGFFIGACLLVFSPAALHRASLTGRPSSLLICLYYMRYIRLTLIVVLVVVVMAFINRRWLVSWIRREQVLLLAVFIETVFLMMIGIDAVHSHYGIELFSLVILLRLVPWHSISNMVVSVMNLAVLVFAACVLPMAHRCYDVCQQELEQASKSELVVTRYLYPDSWLQRYFLDYSCQKFKDEKVYGYDTFLNRYFGHDVLFLPEEFVSDLERNTSRYSTHWRTNGAMPFYAKRVNEADAEWEEAVLTYSPSHQFDRLPAMLARLCNRLAGYKTEVRENKLQGVTVKGGQFILVPRRYPEQDERLLSIRLE